MIVLVKEGGEFEKKDIYIENHTLIIHDNMTNNIKTWDLAGKKVKENSKSFLNNNKYIEIYEKGNYL